MKRSLTRHERLRRRSDLQRVFAAGNVVERRGMRLFYLRSELSRNRIAACPVRGFRKAVDRNRARRVCREAYRTLKDQIETGYDLAFVLYPGDYGFSDRLRQMRSLLEQAGLKR
jgi:ribonuclease P protein component